MQRFRLHDDTFYTQQNRYVKGFQRLRVVFSGFGKYLYVTRHVPHHRAPDYKP
jgi:hypothetical protein